jgi:hypothetical protein
MFCKLDVTFPGTQLASCGATAGKYLIVFVGQRVKWKHKTREVPVLL